MFKIDLDLNCFLQLNLSGKSLFLSRPNNKNLTEINSQLCLSEIFIQPHWSSMISNQ